MHFSESPWGIKVNALLSFWCFLHFANKLFALEALSQSLLLGEPNLRKLRLLRVGRREFVWAVMNPHIHSFFRNALKSRLANCYESWLIPLPFPWTLWKLTKTKMRTESTLYVMEELTYSYIVDTCIPSWGSPKSFSNFLKFPEKNVNAHSHLCLWGHASMQTSLIYIKFPLTSISSNCSNLWKLGSVGSEK